VIGAVDPAKDVDGFHPENLGRLLAGSPGVVPCTPAGVLEILDPLRHRPEGAEAVVVGRSRIVGKPLGAAAPRAPRDGHDVPHARRGTSPRTPGAPRSRGSGRPAAVVTGDMVRPDAVVVDVGVNRCRTASSPATSTSRA
jgi:methylenetetrahydrofolate dehydrogenase (NADP+)/methenyltetrahydrofolate cyclohydrolase